MLKGCNLGDPDFYKVAQSLKQNSTLTELNLGVDFLCFVLSDLTTFSQRRITTHYPVFSQFLRYWPKITIPSSYWMSQRCANSPSKTKLLISNPQWDKWTPAPEYYVPAIESIFDYFLLNRSLEYLEMTEVPFFCLSSLCILNLQLYSPVVFGPLTWGIHLKHAWRNIMKDCYQTRRFFISILSTCAFEFLS